MSPKLYTRFFKISIHSFHFFGVLGFIGGMLLGVSLCYFLGMNVYIILLMTLIGAGTFFLLAFIAKWVTKEETIVYYHHEIAILVFCAIALKLLHYPVLHYIDVTLLGIGTFLAFGRIGCFNVGCCHGRPGKFGYHYDEPHVQSGFTWYFKNVTLLPVQLVESSFVFCIVITGSFLLFTNAPAGTVLVLYTVVYGAFRFGIEFFRGDPERPYYKGLSEAQWTTLLLISISLILSYSGTLPLYNWHVGIFIILCAVSLNVIFLKRRINDYRLTTPRHIQEIATGLQHMKFKKQNSANAAKNGVDVYTTTEGLSFSSGVHDARREKLTHYTLSGNSALVLDGNSSHKIGKIIGLINKHSGDFEIIKKDSGIYHIVFKEKQVNEKLAVEQVV
ncbi:MAG: prolipoprotein diacylglyceryl transferase family protein [Ginsengibacter sp.]